MHIFASLSHTNQQSIKVQKSLMSNKINRLFFNYVITFLWKHVSNLKSDKKQTYYVRNQKVNNTHSHSNTLFLKDLSF